MKRILTITLCFVCTFYSFSQKGESSLKIKFKEADTVLLVSHELPWRYTPEEAPIGKSEKSKKTNSTESLELIINGKINYRIIHEKLVLRNKQIDSLIKILRIPNGITSYTPTNCFDPHHAIIIIKKGKVSYIELCFGCIHFETSKDLEGYIVVIDDMWPKLKKFFLRNGFRYELKNK